MKDKSSRGGRSREEKTDQQTKIRTELGSAAPAGGAGKVSGQPTPPAHPMGTQRDTLGKSHTPQLPLPSPAQGLGRRLPSSMVPARTGPSISHPPHSPSCRSTQLGKEGGNTGGPPKTHTHTHTHVYTHTHARPHQAGEPRRPETVGVSPRHGAPAGASGTLRLLQAFALCSLPSTGLGL